MSYIKNEKKYFFAKLMFLIIRKFINNLFLLFIKIKLFPFRTGRLKVLLNYNQKL